MADLLPPVTVRSLLRAAFWSRWGVVVGALWSIIGILDGIDARVAPKHPAFKAVWDQIYVLPSVSWQTWIAMVALSLLVLGLHGAYSMLLIFCVSRCKAAGINQSLWPICIHTGKQH